MDAEQRAREIGILVLDVDGVLTDGGLYYDAKGSIMKRFHVQDGLGIKMAQAADLEIAVITGLSSDAVRARVMELGIEEYHFGHKEKIPLLESIAERSNLPLTRMAFMGDDWVDAGPMSKVGLAMAPANAQPEIKSMAHWVSERSGGNGAVRDGIRFILQVQGKLDQLWQQWFS